MTAPIDYTIRRKLLLIRRDETLKFGVLTVRVFINADIVRWIIQGAGVVHTIRYPRREGWSLDARIAVTSYILRHYRGSMEAAA